MKTILFVNPVGIIGGAERVLLAVMAALQIENPELRLHLIVGAEGTLVQRAEELGVNVKVLPLPNSLLQLGDSTLKDDSRIQSIFKLFSRIIASLLDLKQYLSKYKKAIFNINPDLIHSNGIKTHLLTGLLSLRNIPIVWHIHDFYSYRPLNAKILKLFSRRANVGIAISKAVALDVQKTLPHLNTQVIYNAIDINHFAPSSNPQLLNPQNTPICVGLVATFARWKGHDIFLQAAAKVINALPHLDIKFCIVGGAIYQTQGSQFSEEELQDLAKSLNIASNVEFLGFQQDIAAVYNQLDIVVHASTQPEPLGMAIIEAMSCAKPVIISQAGGAAELFTHDFDAIGFELGNANALATAIQYLIENPQQREYLSQNARNTALSRFSQERLGKQILNLYRGIMPESVTK